MKALRIYDHISADQANSDPPAFESLLGDKILQDAMATTDCAKGSISFVFVKKHGLTPPAPDAIPGEEVSSDLDM